MKPITDCKQQEQDYRQKMSACNVSYRHKRSGPKQAFKSSTTIISFICEFRNSLTADVWALSTTLKELNTKSN